MIQLVCIQWGFYLLVCKNDVTALSGAMSASMLHQSRTMAQRVSDHSRNLFSFRIAVAFGEFI